MAAHVLIVEDDPLIAASLQRALEATGYTAAVAIDGAAAFSTVQSDDVDLVLLDLGLPDGDGIEVARKLIAHQPQLPIIMVTARAEEADVVSGLHTGAVDYLTKPFRLAELLARIRAHLRTTEMHAATARHVTVGDVQLDLAARRVWVNTTEVRLPAKEFDLLARLARQPGQVVSRNQLLADVWQDHWGGSSKTLDVHIAGLRRHLGEQPGTPSRITALRGIGYRLDHP